MMPGSLDPTRQGEYSVLSLLNVLDVTSVPPPDSPRHSLCRFANFLSHFFTRLLRLVDGEFVGWQGTASFRSFLDPLSITTN